MATMGLAPALLTGIRGKRDENNPSRVPASGSRFLSASIFPPRSKRVFSQRAAAARHSGVPVMGG